MSSLTEADILARHEQALGEAKRACQRLGRHADPEFFAPRGEDYGALRSALQALEGTSRQMVYFRSDTRWVKLGILYARAMRTAQLKFVGQKWMAFREMQVMFERGLRSMTDLRDRKTGIRGAILPSGPTDWLILPDHKVPTPNRGTVH